MKRNFIQRHKRHLLGGSLVLLLMLLLRAILFWSHVHAPLKLQTAHMLDVSSGATLTRIVKELEKDKVLTHAADLLLYAKLSGTATRIKAGEYELTAGLSARGLLDLLASGKVSYHQLRLGEGWTLRQALVSIQSNPAIVTTLNVDDTAALQASFGTSVYPEGLFFPDTYNFTKGTTDLELLQRAKQLMEDVLSLEWSARDAGLPYETPYDALILASIIEKETSLPQEQDKIAGVFIRRLQLKMRLQTDPTVIYGLGPAFDGNLTRANLQQDSDWNTYTRSGLPATPIALPGLGAIEASMHPDQSDALYFVARGDGSHYFSSTLEEHNRAVRQYQLGEQP